MNPGAYKPFIILFIYLMVYQFGGVNTITFYAVEIFQETGSAMDKNTCTIMLGVTRLFFTVLSIMSLRKFGRRPLTFISSKFLFHFDDLTVSKLTFYSRCWMWNFDDRSGHIFLL